MIYWGFKNVKGLNISKFSCLVFCVMINFHTVRKLQLILLVLFGLAVLFGIVFFFIGYLKPKVAGIYVTTTPESSVYINGVQVGRTPFRDSRKPGEIVVKLIPDSFETPLVPYETRLDLVNGVETVVRWEFGVSEDLSSGEIVAFEKISKGDVGLAVVSTPDSAQITIDGQYRDYAPYKTSALAIGEHVLKINAEGYKERSFGVKTHSGYQVAVFAKMAKVEEAVKAVEEEVVDEEEEKKVEKIEILSTPVGFLRVRKGPSTLDAEIGRVEPGDEYVLLEEDEKTGWFKIQIDDETAGWVSDQYAKRIVASEDKDSEDTDSDSKITPTETE